MDKLHKPLVATWQATGSCCNLKIKVVLSVKMCARSARNGSLNEMEFSCSRIRQADLTKAVSASGRVPPNRPASLPVSPVANMDVSVEESGLVSVEEFGPTSAEEGVVQETEELKHVSSSFALQSRSGGTQGLASAIQKLMFCVCSWPWTFTGPSQNWHETNEAEQIPTVSVDYAFFGRPEGKAHNTLPVLSSSRTARVKASGVTWCRQRVWRTHILRKLWWPIWISWDTRESSSSQIRSHALLPSVTLSRMVGTARFWSISQGRKQEQRRGGTCCPSVWNHPGISKSVCWPGWFSIVPIFSYSSTKVSHTMVTQPTCDSKASPGELRCRVLASA